jgi:hypothetical protein
MPTQLSKSEASSQNGSTHFLSAPQDRCSRHGEYRHDCPAVLAALQVLVTEC